MTCTSELRKALSLVADAAIAADDAANRNDIDGLNLALMALRDNADTANNLASQMEAE